MYVWDAEKKLREESEGNKPRKMMIQLAKGQTIEGQYSMYV